MIDIYEDDDGEDDEEGDDDVAHASRVAKKKEKAQSPTSAHLHICSLGHPPRHICHYYSTICLSPAFKAESIIGAQAALHQQHARWYNRCLPSGPKHRPLCIYMCVCMCAALKTFKHKPTGANQPNVHHKLEDPHVSRRGFKP